ncbi:MAG: DUF3732 domain-containing protein [Gammaproteobacteria bacterium]|nr:DUF3732 domain-containing protein [Gammaproteobacteria bacterium]
MKLQVEAVILWPRDTESAPRVLKFKPGLVNVITGGSKTGKSAIIPILDYCLGADKCTIPVGPIREACSWFGVLLVSEYGRHLLARREPENQQSTADMHLLEGNEVSIPDVVHRNISVGAVKGYLDELAGLTKLDFDVQATGSGFKGRPSFRDMTAFIFQPQNVVANPAVLFYKADSYAHREKLRTIFPYVLGAVSPEILAMQHEVRRLQLDLSRKEREFQALHTVSERWLADLRARMVTARELGLITDPIAPDSSLGPMLMQLRSVVDRGAPMAVGLDTISEAVEELVQVEREETLVSANLANLRMRFTELSRLRNSADAYKQALEIKLDRLSLADWMVSHPLGEKACPICGGTDAASLDEVDALADAMKAVEREFESLSRAPASFGREQERVRAEIDVAVEQLEALQIRRRALTARSEQMRERQYTEDRVSRFLGSLEQALKTYEQLGEDGALSEELTDLRRRLGYLRRTIGDSNVQRATSRALDRFALFAQRIVPRMDVERPHDPIHLSIVDLTLRIQGKDRPDYLWEIGSGANWVAYHLATIIALQQLFRGLSHSPVPSLSVFDQPSQVYFPRPSVIRSARSNDNEEREHLLGDEDLEAVRLIFSALSNAAVEAHGEWQAIVLDHADRTVWGGLPGVHLVEEWRGGDKLVPEQWVSA